MDNEKILEALFQPVISTEETKPEDDDCGIVCCDPDEYDDYGNEYEDEDEYENEYAPFENPRRVNMLRDLSNTILGIINCLEDYDHGYSDNQYTYICDGIDKLQNAVQYLDTEVQDYHYIG